MTVLNYLFCRKFFMDKELQNHYKILDGKTGKANLWGQLLILKHQHVDSWRLIPEGKMVCIKPAKPE